MKISKASNLARISIFKNSDKNVWICPFCGDKILIREIFCQNVVSHPKFRYNRMTKKKEYF